MAEANVSGHFGGTGLDAETLTMMLDAVGAFVAHALPPQRQLQLDHDDVCPEDTVRAMSDPAQLGVQLIFIPAAYGGMDGGAFDSYRVCEAMARHDIGLATAAFATFLGIDRILAGATEEQKQRWLGAIAEKGIVFAYGATEPDAGSDLGAMKTVAERIGPRRAARAKAARPSFRCNNNALLQRLSAGTLSCARARFGGLCTSGARFRPRRTRQARSFRRSFIAWSSKCHARAPTFACCRVYLSDIKAMDPISVFLVAFGVGCFTGVCLVSWSRYRRKTPPALPRDAATHRR